MATYEFKCQDCGHEFEMVLSFEEHESRKPKCPRCKSNNVRQKISAFYAKTDSKT